MSTTEPYITCPLCGWTSFNPGDVENQYCNHCHRFQNEISDSEIQHATWSRERLERFARTGIGRLVFRIWGLTLC